MKQKLTWIMVLCVIGIAACTKIINTEIGADGLIPPVDGVKVKDTVINVFAKTWGFDSAKVPIQEMNILGYSQNNTFGKTTASINIQMQPGIDSFHFPVSADSLQLDSVVLVLGTGGLVYGDTTQNLAFRVFEINNTANFGHSEGYPYLTTTVISQGAELTYNNTAKVVPPLSTKDSVYNYLDTTKNQLRVRLSNSFGDRLLKDYSFNHEYQTDSTFRSAFKGFQIVPEATGNALLPIVLTSNNTKLAIYYRYTKADGSGLDTAIAYFRPNGNSASSNYIQKDRNGAELSATQPVGDLNESDNYLYVESDPGVYSRISLPALSTFPKSLIYKAELILTQDANPSDASTVSFKEAPNLFIAAYDTINKRRTNLSKDIQPTLASNGLSYITSATGLNNLGIYPYLTVGAGGDSVYQYRLNITRHIQDVLLGKVSNFPLDVYAPTAEDSVYDATLNSRLYIGLNSTTSSSFNALNYPSIGQIRLAGSVGDSTKRIRLHIVYSPVKTN